MNVKWMLSLAVAFLMMPCGANAGTDILGGLIRAAHASIDTAPTTGKIEYGFSPEGGAERLVLKTINSARRSLRLAAYSFTSPPVVEALIAAKRRGVDVGIVVDEKSNVNEDRTNKSRAALGALVNAGVRVRTNSRYAIHHDKYIVADGLHVETGSFNYSTSAATRNSENVIVIWNNPEVAAGYLKQWESRFAGGQDYRTRY